MQKLGSGVEIGKQGLIHCKFGHQTLCIGKNVSIGGFAHISAYHSVKIGENVLMGLFVTIVDNGHGYSSGDKNDAPIKRSLKIGGGVIIEDNVWIGDKVTICPGVKIGYGAIIGANAVVTKDVEPYSVYVGIPARRIS